MIKNLYCNGCSTMAGGGLEPIQKDRMKYYKEKFGLEWQSERDIIWPKLVADQMGYTLFDYSKSGAGIERYIRETYDYIYQDFERAKETIFFLELPVIWNKVDIWSNIHNRYLICNIDLTDSGNFKDLHLCDDYWYQSLEERNAIEKELVSELRESFKKTWSVKQYEKKILKNLIGLLGYMKYKNYTFYILPQAIQISYIKQFLPEIDKHIMYFTDENGGVSNDFHNWSNQYKMQIRDESEGLFDDSHPGYFAHIKWADLVIKKLKNEQRTI